MGVLLVSLVQDVDLLLETFVEAPVKYCMLDRSEKETNGLRYLGSIFVLSSTGFLMPTPNCHANADALGW